MKCFDCGSPALYQHHVVPRALGGNATVPLCGECHAKVHGNPSLVHISALTKVGLGKARKEGRVGGRPRTLTPTMETDALAMIAQGESQASVSRLFDVSRSTICRLVKTAKPDGC